MNTDKIWYRGVMKYLQKQGSTPIEIHANMVDTLRDDALGLSSVQKRTAELRKRKKVLKMIEGLDGQQLPPLQKLLTVFTKQ